jgi:murein DD-endopeptidase MepM/ murein hydrolase activator NlpD
VAGTVVSLAAGAFDQETLELPDDSLVLLEDVEAIEAENQTLEETYAGLTEERLWSGAWSLPSLGPITNPFGLQRSINDGPYNPHSGTDIAAEEGTTVTAAADGRIAFAGALHLRGNSVIIDHGAGVFTGYHHMQSISVSQGDTVAAGDLVGFIGQTGFVSGPHLHWEAIVRGVRVDPTLWTFRAVEP